MMNILTHLQVNETEGKICAGNIPLFPIRSGYRLREGENESSIHRC